MGSSLDAVRYEPVGVAVANLAFSKLALFFPQVLS